MERGKERAVTVGRDQGLRREMEKGEGEARERRRKRKRGGRVKTWSIIGRAMERDNGREKVVSVSVSSNSVQFDGAVKESL